MYKTVKYVQVVYKG